MKRAFVLLLALASSSAFACNEKKKAQPVPVVALEAAAPPASSTAMPACDVAVEMRSADLEIVPSARAANQKDATKLVVSLSGNRAAVLNIGATGAEDCEGGRHAVHRQVDDPRVADDVIVYDDESTPLQPGENGCEQAGPPSHTWHAVDTRTKKEWVIRGDAIVSVEPKTIAVKQAGCGDRRFDR